MCLFRRAAQRKRRLLFSGNGPTQPLPHAGPHLFPQPLVIVNAARADAEDFGDFSGRQIFGRSRRWFGFQFAFEIDHVSLVEQVAKGDRLCRYRRPDLLVPLCFPDCLGRLKRHQVNGHVHVVFLFDRHCPVDRAERFDVSSRVERHVNFNIECSKRLWADVLQGEKNKTPTRLRLRSAARRKTAPPEPNY